MVVGSILLNFYYINVYMDNQQTYECTYCKEEKSLHELDTWYGNKGVLLYRECIDKKECKK